MPGSDFPITSDAYNAQQNALAYGAQAQAYDAMQQSRINQLQFAEAMKKKDFRDIVESFGATQHFQQQAQPNQLAATVQPIAQPAPAIAPQQTPQTFTGATPQFQAPQSNPAPTGQPTGQPPAQATDPINFIDNQIDQLNTMATTTYKDNKDFQARAYNEIKGLTLQKQAVQQAQDKKDADFVAEIHKISPTAAIEIFNNKPNLLKLAGGKPITVNKNGEFFEYKDADDKVIARSYLGQDGKWSKPVPVKDNEGKGTNFQEKGVTAIGGFTVSYDPKNAKNFVTKTDGTQEPYDPKKHGKILSTSMSQTTIYNQAQQQGDEFKSWEPDTKEMAFQRRLLGKEESPAFGFGMAAANSRKQFEHEYNKWLVKGGKSAGDIVSTAQDMKALGKAENTNEGFINRTNTFVNQIEGNVKQFNELRAKYGNNFGRMVNQANNMMIRGIKGSGDLESLRLILFSTSAEITKLETGQLGIATIPVEQQKVINKIHDINLNEKDIIEIMETGKKLAKTRQQSLTQEKARLKEERSKLGASGKQTSPQDNKPESAAPKAGDVIKGYKFKGGNPADKNNWEKQ